MQSISIRRALLVLAALSAFVIAFGFFTAPAHAKDHDDNGHHYGQNKDHDDHGNSHSTTTTTCSPSTTTTTFRAPCTDPAPCPTVTCGTDSDNVTVVNVPACPQTPACVCPLPESCNAKTFPVYQFCKRRKDHSLKCKKNAWYKPTSELVEVQP